MPDEKKIRTIKPLGFRYGLFRFFIWLYVAIIALSAVIAYAEYGDFSDAPALIAEFYTQLRVLSYGDAFFVALVLAVLGLVACFVAYALFFQRAMHNVWAKDVDDVTVQPFAMWAWYLVPFANLLMPYRGVSQVYKGSINPDDPSSVNVLLVRYWWAFWLLANIIENLDEYLIGFSASAATIYLIGVVVCYTISSLLLLELIKNVYEGQKRNFFDGA